MPLPVLDIGPAFHVAFHWTDGTQFAFNTMSFHALSGGTDADLAAALDAQYLAGMTPDVADSAHVDRYDITPYDGTHSATPFATSTWVGHTGGQWVPQVSEVVSFRTGIASRRARGRLYLPFITESSISDGAISSGSEPTMRTAWDTFIGAMADDGFQPIVASTVTEQTETVHNPDGSVLKRHPTGVAYTPTGYDILSVVVPTKLATQRRRQSRI